jgi:hypothetical protein
MISSPYLEGSDISSSLRPHSFPKEISPDKILKAHDGEDIRFVYHLEDYLYAKNQGFIIKNPKDLKTDRSYTFVLLEDKKMRFGLVENGLEFGVKHFQLAQGEPVLASGELSLKDCKFNLESGTYNRKRSEEEKKQQELVLTDYFKKTLSDRCLDIEITKNLLVSNELPSEISMQNLCSTHTHTHTH